jgi:hypothetical protein
VVRASYIAELGVFLLSIKILFKDDADDDQTFYISVYAWYDFLQILKISTGQNDGFEYPQRIFAGCHVYRYNRATYTDHSIINNLEPTFILLLRSGEP